MLRVCEKEVVCAGKRRLSLVVPWGPICFWHGDYFEMQTWYSTTCLKESDNKAYKTSDIDKNTFTTIVNQ